MNDAGPKKSPFGVNVTDWPSVVAAPADTAPTDVTVSPRPSGSMSLPRTGMVTAWPWFVVAWSPRAWGGGADGAVTVSDTVAVADSPAASVTVYWNESVVSVPSRGAVAWTSDPSEPVCCSATAPCAGDVIANANVSSGSGSSTRAPRSTFLGIPASTVSVVSEAVGGRFDGGSTSIVTAPATAWPCWSSTE